MIRKADLENHNKDGGQWIVIGGQVYDIEDFRSASMADSEDITKLLEATASQGKFRDVEDGWTGWTISHPGFGRSVNPISTRGGRLCSPHYYLPTQI